MKNYLKNFIFIIVLFGFTFICNVNAGAEISLCASGCDYDNLDDALDFASNTYETHIHIMDDNTYEITKDYNLQGYSNIFRLSNSNSRRTDVTDNAINIEGNNHTITLDHFDVALIYSGSKEFNINNLNIKTVNENDMIAYILEGDKETTTMNINNCSFDELSSTFGSSTTGVKFLNIKNSAIPYFSPMGSEVSIYNSNIEKINNLFSIIDIHNSKLETVGNMLGTINIYDSTIPRFNYIKVDYMESISNPSTLDNYNVSDVFSNDYGYPEDQVNTFFHTKKDTIMVEGNRVELNELLDAMVKDREAQGSSNDESIAKIENGKVVALKEGKTTLTVTTDSGHYIHNISLTVIKKEETNKKGIITVKEKGKIKLAEVFDVLSDYEGEIEWTISDPSIAKIENGEIVPLKSGTITITAVIDGVTYTYDLTITDNVPEKIMHTTIKVPITGKEIEIWVIISVVMSILIIVGTMNLLILKKRKSNNKDLNENKKDE